MAGRAVTHPDVNLTGASLPALDWLAPAVSVEELAAAIEAWTKPGDVVLDLNGRGGWVAQAAIREQRRAADLETWPLTRLLAEVVLRPPDLRQLDAAVGMLAATRLGGAAIHDSIEAHYASICATCGRPVILDAMVWQPLPTEAARPPASGSSDDEGGAKRKASRARKGAAARPAVVAEAEAAGPKRIQSVLSAAPSVAQAGSRSASVLSYSPDETLRVVAREYRCARCREQLGGSELRRAEPTPADMTLALSVAASGPVREAMRRRFPAPRPTHPLVDQLIDLHTPRQLLGLHGILTSLEADAARRDSGVLAALRVALIHAVLTASRLNVSRDRLGLPRISSGSLKVPVTRQWRERNPWLAFEEGVQSVKAFVGTLEAATPRGVGARIASDFAALEGGTANAVVVEATPAALRRLGLHAERTAHTGLPSRTRLLLGQTPLAWTPERLAGSYLATGWVFGAAGVSMLPYEALFRPTDRLDDGQRSVELARSVARTLAIGGSALSSGGRAVVLLDDDQPATLVGAVLGGAAAGCRLAEARLRRPGDGGGGIAAFVPPAGSLSPMPRSRANRPLEPLPGQLGDPGTVRPAGLLAEAEKVDEGPFKPEVVAQNVTETAAAMLRARGEPASFGLLLGELLLGLDRTGQLARLARQLRPERADQGWDAWVDQGPDSDLLQLPGQAHPDLTESDESPGDRLLGLIRGELDRPTNRRVRQIEPDAYWLAATDDVAKAAQPLSDRLEWAVFSLLSSAGQLSRRGAIERLMSMFKGGDTPDRDLIEACLDSYHAATSTPEAITGFESLENRGIEHDAVIARLTDLGHRLGMQVWIGERQQTRRVGGFPLGSRLDREEREVHLPVIAWAPEGELERVDCAWYVRRRASFLFEVEWTAMLGEPILTRHARYPEEQKVVRFLVLPQARAALAAFKVGRSPLLRQAIAARNWHFWKWNHLAEFAAGREVTIEGMEPYLGLDALADRAGEQLSMFGL